MKRLYEENKLGKKDTVSLDTLTGEITDDYTRGKINKQQFDKLVEEISATYWEIFNKEIDSFTNLSKKDRELNELKDNIEYAYARGRINEQRYELLKLKIRTT